GRRPIGAYGYLARPPDSIVALDRRLCVATVAAVTDVLSAQGTQGAGEALRAAPFYQEPEQAWGQVVGWEALRGRSIVDPGELLLGEGELTERCRIARTDRGDETPDQVGLVGCPVRKVTDRIETDTETVECFLSCQGTIDCRPSC